MRAFKALLRGFKDLSDGSNTGILDIPTEHIPDNPKFFRQKWVWVVLEDDFEQSKGEGIPDVLKQRLIDGLEGVLKVLREE